MMRPVDIAGGGIAGLALGLALRREGVPVRVHEAGVYPRHRVCGEFISGAGLNEFARLGIEELLSSSEVLTDAVWYIGNRPVLRRDLPEPAHGISRWKLDAAMAGRLTNAGGEVRCSTRVTAPTQSEGWVTTTGRPRAGGGPWLALKGHYLNLPMEAGLEMHLGRGGYTGIARVENETANVCALLPASLGRLSIAATLPDRLRANGLTALAKRLEAAQPVEASRCGVSQFVTGWQEQTDDRLHLGDHSAIIPPFTGHGMSMAVMAALEAAPCLAEWSSGRARWSETVQSVNAALQKKFRNRMRWAAWLHPVLLRPSGQAALQLLAHCRLLPWQWLFHRLR